MSHFKTHHVCYTVSYDMLRRTLRARSNYNLFICHLIVHHTLIHSRHREIDFYSFYRSNSSFRRWLLLFLVKSMETGPSRDARPTTNYFPVKRDDISNPQFEWRNKVCMMSRKRISPSIKGFIILKRKIPYLNRWYTYI